MKTANGLEVPGGWGPQAKGPRWQITFVDPRKGRRTVGPEHFANSAAFAPVLELAVGQSITERYRSAGYRVIRRIS